MAIGRFGSEDPEDRIRREAFENTPIGAPCKSDYADELDAAIAYAKEEGLELSELAHEEVLKRYRDRKQVP